MLAFIQPTTVDKEPFFYLAKIIKDSPNVYRYLPNTNIIELKNLKDIPFRFFDWNNQLIESLEDLFFIITLTTFSH